MKRAVQPVICAALMVSLLAACGDGQTQNEAAGNATTGKAPIAVPSAPAPLIDPANVAALRGEKAFLQCAACHAVVPGGTAKIGPNLANVYGRKAGSISGYSYSAALSDSDLIWTDDNLNRFIERPSSVIAGSKMVFAGVAEPGRRSDIIAYLEAIAAQNP